jgi:hypothetical protein
VLYYLYGWDKSQLRPIDNSGVQDVVTHTSRFDDFDGSNQIMIDRLQQIADGAINPTPADLRYYTHELEELRRYRALGHPDDQIPSNSEVASDLWENTHSATLETYSIIDESSLFFR